MVPLSCPLCCNETFNSHVSLKYHILGMVDHLLCPSCNERCEDLMDLADHLGQECINLPKTAETDAEQPTDDNSDLTKVKEEVQECSEDIHASGDVAKQTSVDKQQVDLNNLRDDPNMIYSCEMCDMTFTSVQEHLAKYHEGEEVVLETEEQEEGHEAQQVDDHTEFGDNSQTDDDMPDYVDSIEGEFEEDISERTENLVNKDGMPYTRTVFRVGTDSADERQDHDDAGDGSPITTKYIVKEGKVIKIDEKEASEISDKSRIIEVHRCRNCNLQFPNMSHFNKHKCTKGAEKKTYPRTPTLVMKRELRKIKEEFRYQCTFCLAIYTSLIGLNDHMKSHLIQDDTGMVQKKTITMTLHVCNVCNTKFPTYKQLRLHARMHEPVKAKEVEPPVSYNIMGQNTEDSTEDGSQEREKFECPICSKSYDKEYEEVHMRSHDGQEQYICLVCNRKFNTKDNLNMHTKVHSNTKRFSCSYCKKMFNDYSALEEHVNKQCQQRDFECQYCGRRFSRPHEKVKHERIHTGEKPHVCEICGKAFRVGYCLTLHMRTHTGNRPYTCHTCGKRFKSHSVYTHHMKTHGDIRPYKCPFCPKAFKTAVQLAGHKNSHTKPFTCNECNRPFASLYAVRAHMETHKRENNLKFDCWVCGASYARSFALRDHMTEAHGQATVEGKNQDEAAGVDLDNITAESHDGDPLEDTNENGTATVDGEYQMTGAEAEMCQVQVLGEEAEGEGYVVHLQEIEANTTVEENRMDVVEA